MLTVLMALDQDNHIMTLYLFGETFKVFLVRLIVADIVIQTLLKGMESLHISLGCLLSLNS